MDVLRITLDEQRCTFRIGDGELATPLGTAVLGAQLTSDPPRPDELSNAIGEVHDALDDVLRELPASAAATTVELSGPAMTAIADVELGATAALPFELHHDDAEDVFRTVATERLADRARNPGLPPAQLDAIVAAGCVLVGVMRRLRLDLVQIVDPSPGQDHPS
ncbi:MAG: hypothetical protein QM733_10790 [Ilumatobacteraceae bacterium]